jgi:DDE family transposase
MTLLQAFDQVPDCRRASGRRHSLPCVLVCLLLGTLSGCLSWRDHGDFVQRHRAAIREHLKLPKDRVPSFSTLRRVLVRIDFDKLSTAFLAWARQHVEIQEGEWLSGDGKSLCGTVCNVGDAQQNFTALVTFYLQKRGLALQCQAYQNAEQSEVHVVQAMLAEAQLEGATLTLDALHCKKNL